MSGSQITRSTTGFVVTVECEGGIDEVDIRVILDAAFSDPLWKDITRFEVVPIGSVAFDKDS